MDNNDLINFVEETTGERHFRVEHDYGNGFVRLESSEAERRQAKQDIRCIEDAVIEMLRNSRDANAHMMFLATGRSGNLRTVTLIDDGQGIPESLHHLVFEPRVTSKLDSFHADKWGVHGRGMALYSIRVNTLEAKVCASSPEMGCALRIVSDATKLSEKTDQSSMPTLVQDDERAIFRGPRNINRTVGEFAVDQRSDSLVFLGSNVEIAATLYDMGCKLCSSKERIFHKKLDEYPVYLRPAFASDPAELVEICEELGIELSERSARRIIDGDIAPLQPFLQLLFASQLPDGKSPTKKDARNKASSAQKTSEFTKASQATSVFLSEEHKDQLAHVASEAFSKIAESYYLDPCVIPQVAIRGSELVIRIPLVEQ